MLLWRLPRNTRATTGKDRIWKLELAGAGGLAAGSCSTGLCGVAGSVPAALAFASNVPKQLFSKVDLPSPVRRQSLNISMP